MATLLELRARIARDAEMYEPLTLLDLTAAAPGCAALAGLPPSKVKLPA